MSWYYSIKTASPKNQIQKFKITEPSLVLFVYKYERTIPWATMTSKEDIIAYIRDNLLPTLYSRIDPESPVNNYVKDVDIEGEIMAHPNDPEVQQAKAIYERDPEGAKNLILKKTNEDKKNAFESWKDYLTEISDITKEDPSFIFIMLKTIIDSSPETQTTPAMVLDAEALAELYQKIQDTGGKQDFNFLKAYKEAWDRSQKMTPNFRKTKGPSEGWMRIPSKSNDPENFDSNKQKLKGYATGQGWCIAGETYANSYLSTGDFYFLLKDGTAVVAIRFLGDKIAEIRGTYNSDPHYYSKQVIEFIEENGFELIKGEDEKQSASEKTYQALKEGKEINEQFENNEIYRREYLEQIKIYPEKYEILYEHNRSVPEVRQALLVYWTDKLLKEPEDYNKCPEDIKKLLPEETESYVVNYWTEKIKVDFDSFKKYKFPKELIKKHERLANAIGHGATKRVRENPWEMSEFPEEITKNIDPEVVNMALTDKTYQLFEEIKKGKENPESLAEQYGFHTVLLDAYDNGDSLGTYDEPDPDIWAEHLDDNGKLDFQTYQYYGEEKRLKAVIDMIGNSWHDYIVSDPEHMEEYENVANNSPRTEDYRDGYQLYEAESQAWDNAIAENPRALNDMPDNIREYKFDEDWSYYVNLWVERVKSGLDTFEDAYDFLDDYPEMQQSFFDIFDSNTQLQQQYIIGTMLNNPHFLFDNIEKFIKESNIIWTNVDEIKEIINSYLEEKPDKIIFVFSDVIEAIQLEDNDYFSEDEINNYMESYRQYHLHQIEESPYKYRDIDLRMQQDPEIIEKFNNKEKWVQYVLNNGEDAFKKAPDHLQKDPDIQSALAKYNIYSDLRYPVSRTINNKIDALNIYEKFDESLGEFVNDPEFRAKAYEYAKLGYAHIINITWGSEAKYIFKKVPSIFKEDEEVLDMVAKQVIRQSRYEEIDQNDIDPLVKARLSKVKSRDFLDQITDSKNPTYLSNYIDTAQAYQGTPEYKQIYETIKAKYIEFLNNEYTSYINSALFQFPDMFVNDAEVLNAAKIALEKIKKSNILYYEQYYEQYPKVIRNLMAKKEKFNLSKTAQEVADNSADKTGETTFKNVTDTYMIPAKIFAFFERKVEDLNKRAQKNNIPGIQYEVLEKKTITETVSNKEKLVYVINVTGVVPQVEGWSFIASIRHGLDDSGQYSNIVSAIPSYEEQIPQKYWKQEPTCEHCRTKRRRNDTFLLKNDETGEFKQCGRNCLADFLRSGSAEDIIRASEILAINQELALMSDEDFDEWGGSGRGRKDISLLNLLSLTNKVVSQIGYVSNKSSQDNLSTKETIFEIINYRGDDFKGMLKELGLTTVETTADDYEIADEAIQWIKGLVDDDIAGNSYLMNIKALSNSAFINIKFMGLAVSIIPSYIRQRDKIRKEQVIKRMREERGDGSPYLGNLNESVEFSVKITEKKGPFRNGSSMLFMGLTDDYKMVKWWGKPIDPFEEGQNYSVIGTPISHTIDKYEKTEVTELRDVIISNGEKQENNSQDPFIGTLTDGKGKMDNFELTLVDAKGPFQSQYSYGPGASSSYMVYIFQDSQGRKAKWMGPADKYDLQIGGNYTIRAKPKEHNMNDRYENSPVTVLTMVRGVQELGFSPEITKEEEDKVQQIVDTALPSTYNELTEFGRRIQRKIEQLNGRFPDLDSALQQKLYQITTSLDEIEFQQFYNSDDAIYAFEIYTGMTLGREMDETEKLYLEAFKELYKNKEKIQELESRCIEMESTPNIPTQTVKLCQFFTAITKAARTFEGAARQMYKNSYADKYKKQRGL